MGPLPEAVHLVPVLDNGGFRADPAPASAGGATDRIPWWSGPVGPRSIKRQADLRWLKLDALEHYVEQPFVVYAPFADELVVRGLVRGHYPNLTLIDGSGRETTVELERQMEPKSFIGRPEPIPFEIRMDYLAKLAEGRLSPRLTLRLGPLQDVRHPTGFVGSDKVYWADLEVLAPMPLPTEAALRAEIVGHLDRIFTTFVERGADREGPRHTGFIAQAYDVVTGEPLRGIAGGWQPLFEYLLYAVELEPNERWRAALDAFCRDYLELGFHPETGLPRKWDCASDTPLDAEPVEARADLRFLLDLVEHGPQPWREPALAAARKLGDAVLRFGVLPDGSVAPKYVPTGTYSLDVPPIRALNLPAQLGRLGGITGDERYTEAARRALAEFEFTHRWGGTWSTIDPDFDDQFGTYGEDALTLLRYHPGDELAARLIQSGWEHFAPLWSDSIRYGGSSAADQVRCWAVLADYAELRPEILATLAPLIDGAARAHVKGEQYDGGAFGDVTHVRYGPLEDIGVGDLSGVPANLLWGLAVASRPELCQAPEDMRALYTAVMRSTFEVYGRDFGLLATSQQFEGDNPCSAGMRMSKGLVAMLRVLEAR